MVPTPRQFLDLGPSGTTDMEEPINSSSEERTLSGSPRNNMELSRNKGTNGREESPESQDWAPNKVPKLNTSKSPADHAAEATMRKARVSVRARSEAPMVIHHPLILASCISIIIDVTHYNQLFTKPI